MIDDPLSPEGERAKAEFRTQYKLEVGEKRGAASRFELFLLDLCWDWYFKGYVGGMRQAQRDLEKHVLAKGAP